MTRPSLRRAAPMRPCAAACVLGGLALGLALPGHATFPRHAPPLPDHKALQQAPRGHGDGLRARRDAAYYRASLTYCRQLHGRVRALCFDEAAKLYAQ